MAAKSKKKAEDVPAATKKSKRDRNAEYDRTPNYVHSWFKIPVITGQRLGVAGNLTFRPRKGRFSVIVFLASWSEPAQTMMKELKYIEKKFSQLDTDFLYVFAHDTRDDAEGFLKQFDISSGMLANDKVLGAYKVQHLPTIYVGDRAGWLSQFYVNTERKDIADLRKYLKLQTAL